MTDPFDTPDAQAWARRVLDDLVPQLADSAATVSVVPTGPADVKFAVELGLSIMFDKPIILAISPGQKVPDHLVRVADEIVEVTPGSGASPLHAALDRLLGSRPDGGGEQ